METIAFGGAPVAGFALGDSAQILHYSEGATALGFVVGGGVVALLTGMDSFRGKHRGGGWARAAYTLGGALAGAFIGRGLSAEPNPDYVASAP